MSTAGWFDGDDELMTELSEALAAADDIPGRLLEAAKASYTWRTVNADLDSLALISESSTGDDLLAVRGDSAVPRLLSFEHNDMGVEIEISGSVVRGQLYPVRSGLITVVTAAGPFADARTDEMGCFVVDWPLSGPVRLRCDTEDSSFVTDWVQA